MSGLAGLGLFLFGLGLLEEGLKALAGRPFKLLLRRHTDRPAKAIVTGMIATMALQSSTVVTLILLALVGSGVLALPNAVGIILGANLGSTATGWIATLVGFKGGMDAVTLPLLAGGSLLLVSTESSWPRAASWGRAIFGLGLLFYGLGMLRAAMGAAASQVDLIQFASYGPLPFALAGMVFAAAVSSSSAVMVTTLAALHAGVIDLASAAAVVVGADLGTTSTVMIGGARGTAIKKRVALAHFLFNLTTDALALIGLPWLLAAVVFVVGRDDPLVALVSFHSAMNLLGIALFFPFIPQFAAFLERRYAEGDDLPPGFEDLAAIDTRLPLAAILHVERSTRALVRRAVDLNRHAFDLHADEPRQPLLLGERGYLEQYTGFKQLLGQLIEGAVRVGSVRLDPAQAEHLARLINASRAVGTSVKDVRDVERNLREFEAAPDAPIHSWFQETRSRQDAFYAAILDLVDALPEGQDPGREPSRADHAGYERLADLLTDNRSTYERLTDAVIRDTASTPGPAERLSERLNVVRGLYSSNKGLVLALKDLLLPRTLATDFDAHLAR